MRQFTWRDRLRYQFDNLMSRGTAALIGWLFLLSACLILVVSLVVVLTRIDPEGRGFVEVAWASLMRTLDPGTMGGDTGSWPFLVSMLVVTVGGIFVVSALIGVLTTGIEASLERLRKGRSVVIERGHTIILGWSPQIFTIISELVIAKENQPRSCIAILADKDKVEMEDEIRAKVSFTGRTRIVCRTGSPIDPVDLSIVNPDAAWSIIVLAPESENPDVRVIKTILALTNNQARGANRYHIVAALRDPKNLDAARMVGRDEAHFVLAGDLISRMAAQTCRQSGLSVAYTELLDFGGDEIYFKSEPDLVGRTFHQALLAYEDSALIGIRYRDARTQLNPAMDTRFEPGDQVIAISRDDDTIRLSGLTAPPVDDSLIRPPGVLAQPAAERTLILGWNRRASTVIRELDCYVAPGSVVTVVADCEEMLEPDSRAQIEARGLRNLAVSFQCGDTTDRRTLDGLGIPSYHHVIVLSCCDTQEPQEADAHTLVTLLHLREIADRLRHPFSIVSEMLDVRNRSLAQVTQADDFIVSDELISLMLSQMSENWELAHVFEDLFDPQGSELYLKPVQDYVQLDRPVTFYTLVEAAARRGEVAIGYRLQAGAHDPACAYGVRLNPIKSAPIAFSPDDRVVVLAEKEA